MLLLMAGMASDLHRHLLVKAHAQPDWWRR